MNYGGPPGVLDDFHKNAGLLIMTSVHITTMLGLTSLFNTPSADWTGFIIAAVGCALFGVACTGTMYLGYIRVSTARKNTV